MDYITQACYYTDLHFDSIVTAPKWGVLHKSCHPAKSLELENVMIKLTMIDFFFFFDHWLWLSDQKTSRLFLSIQKWRPFCNMYEGKIEDYNFGTLLRYVSILLTWISVIFSSHTLPRKTFLKQWAAYMYTFCWCNWPKTRQWLWLVKF